MGELAIDVEEAVAEALGHFVPEVVDISALLVVSSRALPLQELYPVIKNLKRESSRSLHCIISGRQD